MTRRCYARRSTRRSASPRPVAPRLASPRLASPRLASPRLASPRLASPRPANPRPANPRPANPGDRRRGAAGVCGLPRHPGIQDARLGQLAAVLAHERAHLAGRRHWLVAMARIGRAVLPFLPLMRDAEKQVARLVELHADDAAPRPRDPRFLPTALVVLPTAASPAPALAAGTTDSVQRIHRLLGPCEPLGPVRRQVLRATAVALALTPVLLALTPAVVALALGKLPGA